MGIHSTLRSRLAPDKAVRGASDCRDSIQLASSTRHAQVDSAGSDRNASVVLRDADPSILLYWDLGSPDRGSAEPRRLGRKSQLIASCARPPEGFPGNAGVLPRGICKFMRSFAAEFPDAAIVKQPASQLPWWHVIRLMQRVKDSMRPGVVHARNHSAGLDRSFSSSRCSAMPINDRAKP